MLVTPKEVVFVRRKNTKTVKLFSGSPVLVATVVTRYNAGNNTEYEFPVGQEVFEIKPRDLPKILSRCDMEVISSIEYDKIRSVVDGVGFNEIETVFSLEDSPQEISSVKNSREE